jgi:hypothetical protein
MNRGLRNWLIFFAVLMLLSILYSFFAPHYKAHLTRHPVAVAHGPATPDGNDVDAARILVAGDRARQPLRRHRRYFSSPPLRILSFIASTSVPLLRGALLGRSEVGSCDGLTFCRKPGLSSRVRYV